MQQKKTSPHLKILWEQDIFKPKWAIIAKAYSIIRGVIGTTNAPLDIFLNLVCPEIGIVSVDEYLEKMNWEVLVAENGTITLRQTSAIDVSSFEQRLIYTTMTEWDIIRFVSNNNYIPQGTIVQHGQLPQQGIFQAAAAPPQPAPVQQPAPAQQPVSFQHPVPFAQHFASRGQFFRSVATNPMATASVVLGFDVKDMMKTTSVQPIQWTGSLADLYAEETGFFDANHYFEERWDVGNLDDPQSFDSIFADSIRDGYVIPTGRKLTQIGNKSQLTPVVPDFDGVTPDYI
jgi:hypothetical protein